MKYPTYQINIPAAVRFDKRLPANAKLLYGEIKALCDQQGYCWANNHYFADLYSVKKETISLWLKQLRERGLVQVHINEKQGNQRQIFLQNLPLGVYDKSEEVQGQNVRGLTDLSPPSSEFTQPKGASLLIENIIDYNYRIHSDPLTNLSVDESRGKGTGGHSNISKPGNPTVEKEIAEKTSPQVAPSPPPRKEEPVRKFIKPSVSDVEGYMKDQEELCQDSLTARGQALRFVNYYEANGWKVGRNPMQDWQAAANNWLLNAQNYTTSKPTSHDRLHTTRNKDYSIPL